MEHDREYAIFDSHEKYVNGKSNALVHLLRSEIDFEKGIIAFRHESAINFDHFHVANVRVAIDEYLSAFFKMPVMLQKNTKGKFLDIPVKSGMTVLSTASLKTVSGWFNDMQLDETRKRFRATIEITNTPAFWEDRLFYRAGTAVEFTIGEVILYG